VLLAVRDARYAEYPAGYESAEAWWTDCVRDAFEQLPGVEPVDDTQERWRYRQAAAGATSTDPGSDVPDDSLAPANERDSADQL
jgi:hypothetical protein